MRLCRLNMDGSVWLGTEAAGLLIDPWLSGPEVDYAGWFNTQWHAKTPLAYDNLPPWDAVVITQKYPDHYHLETLRRLAPQTVFASFRVASRIERALPETTIRILSDNSPTCSWQGVTMTLLTTRRRIDPFYDAVYFDDADGGMLFAPHGLALGTQHLELLSKRPQCRLIMAPYNRYTLPALLGGVVSPGLPGLKTLVEQLSAPAVCRLHDELKHSRGLIGRLAKIEVVDTSVIQNTPWLADLHVETDGYMEFNI